ncbi:LOW QUALITY PROTEIN: hypothetical protein U9M48_017985 [Paspalum notatum var. saurae]|uniref:Protein kinase domain-containing protein n=1 Tax=Paspalum notatum var. saurae TaxID=547442 RepID=A0AAQ3T9V0_PASNO
MAMTKQLRRVRTLGRGASGAVVWLASDDASGELVAVKSARAAGAAAQLQREGRVLEGLSSPHIVPCLGARAAAGGEYQLLLEFAPGGSLADEAARHRLGERDIAAYAGDVARGLAYLHGIGLVHGDVKARNVVIGADGRARLTDFGCARPAASARTVGGTPAFMAPEVARGEAQGPPADVWALGCTVVEMATGRAPWGSAGDADDLLAALHRIGYTDAVPEVPDWLSADAKDFLSRCFQRRAAARPTAAQLLAHPFVAARDFGFPAKQEQEQEKEFPSPNTTLLHDDAFWDSDTDGDDDEMSTGAAERIGALACAASALPDWDSDDDGWIDLRDHSHTESTVDAPPAAADYFVRAEPSADAELVDQLLAAVTDADAGAHLPRVAGVTDADVAISHDSYLLSSSSTLLLAPIKRISIMT